MASVFFCAACGVECGSQLRLDQHNAGRRHRAAAATAVGSAAAVDAVAGVKLEPEPEPSLLAQQHFAAVPPLAGSIAAAVVAGLSSEVSVARLETLQVAVAQRCGALHLAFENIFKNDNCAHALRTAECAGIHNVHLIRGPQTLESKRGGSLKRVDTALSKSADRWLKLHYHVDTAAFVRWLALENFSLYGAHFDPTARPVAECDFAPRIERETGGNCSGGSCVVFGNERDGMSAELRTACDGLFFLPSVGLTQSYNVAAACAMTIYHLLLAKHVVPDLSPAQQQEILASWLLGFLPRHRVEEALARQGELSVETVQALLQQKLSEVAPFDAKQSAT
jgi:tRNA (guanosine-2'-O-)-methyltransferase